MNAPAGTAAPMDGGVALRRALAVGLVVLLHLGLLWALMRGLQVRAVPPAPPPTVYLRILHVAPPLPIVQQQPPKPQPRTEPKPKPTPKPRPIVHHAPRPVPPPPRPAPPPPAPAPPPTPAPAPVQAPPAPPAPPTPPAPPPPPAPPAPPHPTAPAAPLAAALVCPHQVRPRMPDLAVEEGLGGTVTAQAVVRDGRVHDVRILSGPEVFHDAVRRAMRQYRCDDRGTQPVTVIQEFRFSVQ